MTATIERRTFTEGIEFRAEGKNLVASGYAYVFNKLSKNLGGFVEQVAPGFGKRSLQEEDVVGLYNHDPNFMLGRLSAGTLRMSEDATGGAYEIDLPDTNVGRDVARLLERRDIVGSSFGFRAIDEEWGETDSGFALRTLKQGSLRDVGPVAFPAYPDASSALRSLAEKRGIDFDVVAAAAAVNELRQLILPHDGEETPDDEGRATPTFNRARITSLYL